METGEEVADPSTFPLAALIQDPVSAVIGKQFRLAFQRKTTKGKSFAFAWPALLSCLAGLPFVFKKSDDESNKLPLDEWAGRNKKGLASFTLKDVQPGKANEPKFQWHLQAPATRSVQFMSFRSIVSRLTFRIDKLSPLLRSPRNG